MPLLAQCDCVRVIDAKLSRAEDSWLIENRSDLGKAANAAHGVAFGGEGDTFGV